MKRRRVLYGIGALVSVSGATISSGAYSTAEANRTIKVNTAPDDDAYLRLTDQISNGSDEFATVTGDGTIQFEFTGDIVGILGNGVGSNSIYEFSSVFAAQNLGSRPVHIFGEYLETDIADIDLLQTSSVSSSPSQLDPRSAGKSQPLTDEDPSDILYPGDTVALGVRVDTNNADIGTHETTLTIKAHYTDESRKE